MKGIEPTQRSFKNAVMSSLHWAALGRFSSQMVTWVITILVIRMLTPADYGLMALGWMFISLFAAFEGIGITAALIQKRDLEISMVQKLLSAVLVFGVLLYGLVWLAAPAIAWFFDERELTLLVRVLAVTIPLAAVGALPLALLQKELQFKRKSMVEFSAAVLSALVTLVMAMADYGVWALAGGIISLTLVQSAGYWLAHGKLYRPDPDMRGIHNEFRFGGLVTIDRMTWLLYSQADLFFVGKFLGKEALGIYAVAMQLASLPMKRVIGFLNEVGFSAFSRIQDDPDEVSNALKTAVRNLALASFPFFLGLAAVAPLVVDVFLDEKWSSISMPLTLLAAVVPLRLVNTLTPTVLFSIGRAGLAAQNSLLALLTLAPAFAFAAVYGTVIHVCLVWVLLYPLYYLVCLIRALPATNVGLSDYLAELTPYAVLALIMFVVVRSALLMPLTASLNGWLALGLLVLLGVAVYVALLFLFARDRLREFIRLVRN